MAITGRKKDLIITSSGKNITPVNIESELRETRYITEAVVFGDNRPYLVAMLTLDRDETAKLAARLGIDADPATIADDPRVRAEIQREVDAVNAKLARIEQIKRFAILDHDLSQAEGEMTPTLKVKRAVVYDKYADAVRRPLRAGLAVMSTRLSSADAAWLHMDRPTNLMVINSVLLFDEPLDVARIKQVYRRRLIGRYPRFRQRVVESRVPASPTQLGGRSRVRSRASRAPSGAAGAGRHAARCRNWSAS